MAESTLSITRVDLLRSIGRFLGLGRDSTAWAANTRIDVNDVIDIGCRWFYSPLVLPGETNSHTWSFMEPILTSFDILAPYATGTVAIVSGVVTLTSGTFPSWAAAAEIVVDGVSYTVGTRNSATSLTLDNLSIDVDSGTEYSLSQVDYVLPDMFSSFVGDLYYKDTNDFRRPIERVNMEGTDGMLYLRQFDSFASRPTRYAIWTTEQTGASGQRWMMSLWPRPDSDNVLTAKYTINPIQLTAALPYPMGGQPHSETLREACMAAAETEIKGEPGIHAQLFLQRLIASVSFDRRASNPGNLGSFNARSGQSWKPWNRRDFIRWLDTTPVTWV